MIHKRSKWTARTDRIFERDRGRCVYCGSARRKLTLDHKVPISRGGPDTDENLVVACWVCNIKKWSRTPDEFGTLKKSLVPIGEVARMIGVSPMAIKAACFVAGIVPTPSHSSWLLRPDELSKLEQIFRDA